MGAVMQDVYLSNDLLNDQELLLYINELDKYQSELKELKKDMRNANADSLDRMYLNKMILLKKCQYYEDILSMVPDSRKKNVQKSRPNYEINLEESEKPNKSEEKKSFLTRIIDKYFEKKVQDYIQYLH